MQLNLRRSACLAIWAVILFFATSSRSQELFRLRYGVTTSLQHLPILVARESGLFSKYGFDVEPVHIRGGALITTMIMSGTVPLSGAGAESVVAARIEGGDVALIACPSDSDAVYLSRAPRSKTPPVSREKAAVSPASVRLLTSICGRR